MLKINADILLTYQAWSVTRFYSYKIAAEQTVYGFLHPQKREGTIQDSYAAVVCSKNYFLGLLAELVKKKWWENNSLVIQLKRKAIHEITTYF